MNIIKITLPLLLSVVILLPTKAQVLMTSDAKPETDHSLHGFSLDIFQDWSIVGAPQEDLGDVLQTGIVHLFELRNETWEIDKVFEAPSSKYFFNFGHSIGMNDKTAMISAIGDDENGVFSGAVYVYEHYSHDSTTTHSQKLVASDGSYGARFGSSISLFDEQSIAVIGAYQANGLTTKSGAAYVYEFNIDSNAWEEKQKLIASDGASNDYFGFSVNVLNENFIAVGAYNADGNAERSGVVYIFQRNESDEWIEIQKLSDPVGQSSELFGYDLSSVSYIAVPVKQPVVQSAFDGFLFVGSPGELSENGKTGSVYVYSFNPTTELFELETQFFEEESEHNDQFGVSIDANRAGFLYVGANRSKTSEDNRTGNVYRYDIWSMLNNSNVSEKLGGSITDLKVLDGLGSQVATYWENVIVGSPLSDGLATINSGKVYFFNSLVTSNEELEEIGDYRLEQNFPNPFNPTTVIKYQVKEAGNVTLSVYNLLGQRVRTLVNEQQNQGIYSVNFDAGNLASGFYFYRLDVNDFVSVKKMMLIK